MTTKSKMTNEPRKRKRAASGVKVSKGKGKAKEIEEASNDEEVKAEQPPKKSKYLFDFQSILTVFLRMRNGALKPCRGGAPTSHFN
jgi:hypothetical protein